MNRGFLAVAFALPMYVAAQALPAAPPPSVQATGEAVVETKPDLAKLDIGVVTQASTAQAAATQNATQTKATLDKLRAALGTAGEIHTSGYSLTPNYQYPRDGGAPSITGYTASNTVEVNSSDIAGIGKIVDAATQGGANRIQGLQFTLKDEAPARAQALRQAAQQARANAEAMAEGMGRKAGAVLRLEQGSPAVIRPIMRQAAAMAAAAPTPVEPGNVEVRATVTVTMQLY